MTQDQVRTGKTLPHIGSTAPSTNVTDTSGTTAPQETGKSSSTPVGAIAGGVVGGVAAICILAAFLVWYLRRQPPHMGSQDRELPDTPQRQKPELSGREPRHEADDGKLAWEVDGTQKIEPDANQYRKKPIELMGNETVAEMPEVKRTCSQPPP